MIKAYAKINVGLRVLGKKDNYHKLEMINTKISLHDNIYIYKHYKTKIIYDKLKINKEDDTIYKMVMDLKYIYPNIPNLLIKIKKHIPVASGLGGMSSDAAAILLYLNKKYDLGLSRREMKRFLLNYGTDMCYCLYNTPCLVTGIGEVVERINLDMPKKVILFYPIIKISTKNVFDNTDINNESLYKKEVISGLKWHDLTKILTNDLEEVVMNQNQEMKEYLTNIKKIVSVPVHMSGSGSCIVIYSSHKKILKTLKKIYPHCVVGRFKIIDNGV